MTSATNSSRTDNTKTCQKPHVSVLMSVYNGAETVGKAVETILAQTLTDFELIIIDDGSSDGSADILEKLARKDSRIRLFRQENAGLTVSLNRAISYATGYYLARQDADDFSVLDRLEIQAAYLDRHPEILLLGSNSTDHYPGGNVDEWGYHAPEELQQVVFHKTPFPHSTVMMRAETARELGGYDESYQTSQDMEFWMRFAKRGPIAMLPEKLIERHVLEGSISTRKRSRQFKDGLNARMQHSPSGRIWAIYYSLRHLIIALLPEKLVLNLRQLVKR